MPTNATSILENIAASIEGAKLSKMFGCPCIKSPNGKACVLVWHDSLVVKPPKEDVEGLLKNGYEMFSPMEGGRAMNGWLVIPAEHSAKWQKLSEDAYEYVSALPKNK